MNIQNRQQILGIAAIAVVVLWAGDRLVVSPLIQSWKQRTQRIVELRKSIRDGKALLERDQSIRSRWGYMRTNTLTHEAGEGQVLSAFDRWSRDSDISVTSVKPMWKQNDEFTTLECRVDASGSLQNLAKFIYSVEKDPVALKVQVVELTAQDKDGRQLTLGLQVSGLALEAAE